MSTIDKYLKELPEKQGKEKVNQLIKLSAAYRTTSFFNCISYGNKAISEAKATKDTILIANALYALGANYLKLSDAKNSLNYFNDALLNYQQINDPKGIVKSLNKIGESYALLAEYNHAETSLTKALNNSKRINYKELTARILENYGIIKIHQKQFKVALNMFLQMRNIGEEIHSQSIIGGSYIGLGILYDDDDANPEKALRYFEKAKKIFIKLGDKEQESRVLNNMAAVYSDKLNEFKKAQNLYEQSLKIKQEINDKKGIALIQNNMGLLYARSGNHAKAIELVNKSLHSYKQIGDKVNVAMVYYNLGDIYLDQEKFTEAVQYYKESYELSKKIDVNQYLYESCKRIFQCYAGLGNFDEFIHYFNIYEEHIDKTITNLKKDQFALTEKKFAKAESGIAGSNNNPISTQASNLMNFKFVVIVSIILLIMFSFLYLYHRENKNKY
ncbi:MAG: tetratricopeptide repeat protein [Bacteroidales bacterium]|nr:tetratricopeptide repeat protein [Bacteroidales bacterium]